MIDLQEVLNRGRVALAAREEARLAEERADEERRRAELLAQWQSLIAHAQADIHPDFHCYMVEPTEPASGGKLGNNLYRPLVFDLTPLGLAPVGAIESRDSRARVGWLAPRVVDDWDEDGEEATGLKRLYLDESYLRGKAAEISFTFEEALALCADRLAEVRRHNDWVTSPKPNEAAAPDGADARVALPDIVDPHAVAATKGGGVWPVIRAALSQNVAHDAGERAVNEFGAKYGAPATWEEGTAIHTMTFVGEGVTFHVYLGLVPVDPARWGAILGGGGKFEGGLMMFEVEAPAYAA
jgi:hypothetical protein